jgi:hypothetical protein
MLGAEVFLAVQNDGDAGRGGDDGGSGADDDALLAAVIGGSDVEEAADGGPDDVSAGAVGVAEAEEFVDGLAFVALEEEEAAGLCGRAGAVEHDLDGVAGFVAGETTSGPGALADGTQVDAEALGGGEGRDVVRGCHGDSVGD